MAGSYGHIVDRAGGILSPEEVACMLDNDGDVYEAIEQMYGMIWYLAHRGFFDREEKIINEARENYQEGLRTAERIIHK